MKATLNITLQGVSADYPVQLEPNVSDRDVKRIAVEVVRSGEVPGLHIGNLPENTFDMYVVDRFNNADGGVRLYLRPKVPFGAAGR
jgi:hypothetical protein